MQILGFWFAPGAGEQEVRASHSLQRIHRIFMKFHRIPVPLEVCPHWFLHRYWCLCEEREGTKRRADLNGGIRSFRMPGAIEMMMDDGWFRCFNRVDSWKVSSSLSPHDSKAAGFCQLHSANVTAKRKDEAVRGVFQPLSMPVTMSDRSCTKAVVCCGKKPYVVKNLRRTSERRNASATGNSSIMTAAVLCRRSSNAFGPAHWCDSCKNARRESWCKLHENPLEQDVLKIQDF